MALRAQIVKRMLMIVLQILVCTEEHAVTRLQVFIVNVHQEEPAFTAISMMPVLQTPAILKLFVRPASSMDLTPVPVPRVTRALTATRT